MSDFETCLKSSSPEGYGGGGVGGINGCLGSDMAVKEVKLFPYNALYLE